VRSIAILLAVLFAWPSVRAFDIISEHGLNNPGLVGRGVVRSFIAVILIVTMLVCLNRGYAWARWLSVAGLSLVSVTLAANQMSNGYFSGWWFLVAVVAAVAACALVYSPDVREFYRARRNAGRME